MSIEARDAAVPASVNQRKRLAFLALLAAAGPHGIARDRLLLLLWPESTTDRARGALYQLLYGVRQALGEHSVIGTDELRLETSIVGSDVSNFNDAIVRGDLAAAVESYGGPFLDGVHLPDAPELERWIEERRQELARSYQSALARLASQAMERRDYSRAIAVAERLVAADPLSERATVLLMEALAASGDVVAALERARVHASVVRRELEVDVDASVSALATRLKSESQRPSGKTPASATPGAPESIDQTTHTGPIRARRRPRAIPWLAAVAGIVVVAGIAALRWPRDPGLEFVVVADLETVPADSQLADVLTDVMRRVLRESRSVRAAPEDQIAAARARLNIPPSRRLTVDSARRLAIGAGIRGVVAGSVRPFGATYILSLHLVSATSGRVVADAEQTGVDSARLVPVLDTVTQQLRARAGDDRAAIRDQPSFLALTSRSLEAMTDYVRAVRLPRDSVAVASALLRRAVTLDTAFAVAWWQLKVFLDISRSPIFDLRAAASDSEPRAMLAKAWNHRQGLTEYERRRVELAYVYSSNGTTPDIVAYIEHLRELVERYPNAPDATFLASDYVGQRKLADAEHFSSLAIALDSTLPGGYNDLINTYMKMGRIRDARRTVETIRSRSSVLVWDVVLSYAEGNRARVREALNASATADGNERMTAYYATAQLDLLEGRFGDWRRRIAASDSILAATKRQRLPVARVQAGYWVFDRPDLALRTLEAAVASEVSLRSNLDAAEYYAQLGHPDSARALLAARGLRDETRYLEGTDTLAVTAWIDLAEKRPRQAVDHFRESLRLRGGNVKSQTTRDAEIGLAFERAGMPDSALASYEHYLAIPPVFDLDVFRLPFVLEHAASLHEAKDDRRDRRRAKELYERLADLWKDADAELQPKVTHIREQAAALR